MESRDAVSHSRMWIVWESEARACRSVRSPLSERTPAMMVLKSVAESCRTNSRPKPRFAPAMTYVLLGNMVVMGYGSKEMRGGVQCFVVKCAACLVFEGRGSIEVGSCSKD